MLVGLKGEGVFTDEHTHAYRYSYVFTFQHDTGQIYFPSPTLPLSLQ